MMLRTWLVAAVLCGVMSSNAEAQIFWRQRPVQVQPAPVYPPNYVQPSYSPQPSPLPVSSTTHLVTAANNCAWACGQSTFNRIASRLSTSW